MEGEPPPVRLERSKRRCTGDVRDPGTDVQAGGNLRNGVVRDADDDQAAVGADVDAALAQARCDRRADPAGSDDRNAVEHL